VTKLSFADPEKVRVGDWVMAIGTPYGLSHTLTVGVVSAQHRRRVFLDSAEQYTNFIQTDAPIHPGNSGGPLLNVKGQVIGISTALQQGAAGIGFALPINVAQAVIPLLRRGGVIHRPWLGMVLPHETDRVYSSGIPIVDVLEDSGAWEAGLRPGDVLVAFNDSTLTHIPDLRLLLTAMSLGGVMNLDFRRNHKLMRARIRLIGPNTPQPKATPTPTKAAQAAPK
jgi:serine protease Do